MLTDVVVDTNVILHADNKNEQRRAASIKFLKTLVDSKTKICVDNGFYLIESKNRSLIGQEYLNHLVSGTLGYAVITELALYGRINMVSRKVENKISRSINKLISNKSDRTFLKVAYNSIDKVLASHDYCDFDANKRQQIKKIFNVIVDSADAIQQKL